jgi:hypothetical protein
MAQQEPESTFDKRIVARNIRRNKITRKDYEQYLKSLKDAKDKSATMFSDEGQKGTSDE